MSNGIAANGKAVERCVLIRLWKLQGVPFQGFLVSLLAIVLYIAAQAQKQGPILAQVGPVNVQVTLQDDRLIRYPANPLLSRGPKGSFDQLKIGPRAILREGPNGWKMWYEGAPAGNKSSVGYATSSDGLNWIKYPGNPIMIASEPWEGGPNGFVGETSPATVLKEDGIYKMWYHSINVSKVRQIGYATSTDAIKWSKYPGNPILKPGSPGTWDSGGIGEPTVIKVGSTFYMYYMRTIERHGIGLATSPDGTYWTKYSGNPILTVGKPGSWDDGAMQIGGVVHDGNIFHMWFRARDAQWNFAIGYAWGLDGKNWMKSSSNPLLTKPSRPLGRGDDHGVDSNTNVFRSGNQWWIYYGGFVFCCPENVGVNLAISRVKTSSNVRPN